MYEEYKGEYEPRYWIRRIQVLIIKINGISNKKINLQKEMIACYKQRTDEYLIPRFVYYQELYRSRFKDAMHLERGI